MEIKYTTLTDLDAWFREEVLNAINRRENLDVIIDIANKYNEHHDNLQGGGNNWIQLI